MGSADISMPIGIGSICLEQRSEAKHSRAAERTHRKRKPWCWPMTVSSCRVLLFSHCNAPELPCFAAPKVLSGLTIPITQGQYASIRNGHCERLQVRCAEPCSSVVSCPRPPHTCQPSRRFEMETKFTRRVSVWEIFCYATQRLQPPLDKVVTACLTGLLVSTASEKARM